MLRPVRLQTERPDLCLLQTAGREVLYLIICKILSVENILCCLRFLRQTNYQHKEIQPDLCLSFKFVFGTKATVYKAL